jgi:hypothetical protein
VDTRVRDKAKTIASLRRLAERPGSPNEGEIARRLLEQLGAKAWVGRPFNPVEEFFSGATIYYCYWAYRNERGVICKQAPKMQRGEWWMRIKFERLKQARWVPVTSPLGCHLSLTPFEGNEQETLYRMDLEWEEHDREWLARFDPETRERILRSRQEKQQITRSEELLA